MVRRFALMSATAAVVPFLHGDFAAAQPVQDRVTTVTLTGSAAPRATSCIPVGSFSAVNNIRNNLSGKYCLTRDIDMKPITNFAPIGGVFTGQLDGKGHVIRNLSIQVSDSNVGAHADYVGMFSKIGSGGAIRNLGLVNAKVGLAMASPCTLSKIGGLAGQVNAGATLSQVYVTGTVTCTSPNVTSTQSGGAGGLVGDNQGLIDASYSTANVNAQNSVNGGLVGRSSGTITRSFAAGRVGRKSAYVWTGGGLVGFSDGTIMRSFAVGPSYARLVGGLVGDGATTIDRSYAVGYVDAGCTFSQGCLYGGLAGGNNGVVTRSYWDTETTAQPTSANGVGKTTAALRAKLQSGFSAAEWSITKAVSFPYMAIGGLNFWAPLAALVHNDKVYIFLPISQLDGAEYSATMAHMKNASLAAVYAMIARVFGLTDGVASLDRVPINTYFWDDATRTASFPAPATTYATLGSFTAIAGGSAIDNSNVLTPIKSQQPVIIRGTYMLSGGGTAQHWMLATSFITGPLGAVTSLVANDPWTGRQVRIDPVTKTVTSANFPLAGFVVDGFQPVTFN